MVKISDFGVPSLRCSVQQKYPINSDEYYKSNVSIADEVLILVFLVHSAALVCPWGHSWFASTDSRYPKKRYLQSLYYPAWNHLPAWCLRAERHRCDRTRDLSIDQSRQWSAAPILGRQHSLRNWTSDETLLARESGRSTRLCISSEYNQEVEQVRSFTASWRGEKRPSHLGNSTTRILLIISYNEWNSIRTIWKNWSKNAPMIICWRRKKLKNYSIDYCLSKSRHSKRQGEKIREHFFKVAENWNRIRAKETKSLFIAN